jgi:lantibiotic transport system permease protein
MTLLWVLHAETLKMKRTIALKMVLLAPATVVLLVLFVASQAPFSTLHRSGISNEWIGLERLALLLWALLMMPLYITLETALVAGLDHSENQWKSLMARPVPRWTWYVAKLIVVMGMIAASTVVLLSGILIDGALLPHLQSQFAFGLPVPWTVIFRDGAQVAGLAFLSLTIQHWVSLRWRSFAVAVGVGIVATVTSYFAVVATQQAGGWPEYFPGALPMLIFVQRTQNIEAALWISSMIGLVVVTAGCLDFCRREVK